MKRFASVAAFLFALVLVGAGCTGVEGVDVVLTAPDAAIEEDANFDFVLTVNNVTEAAVPVTQVTISEGLYEGLLYEEAVPEVSDWNIDDFGNYVLEYEDLTVPAGESLDITLTMNAFFTGDYFGSVDICFEDAFTCSYNSTSITIE